MRRLTTPLSAFALLVAGCGGGQISEETFETVPPPSTTAATTEVPPTDTNDPTTTSAPAVTSEPVVVDGPPAPDFALALHDGLGFILSQEPKPVYLVFWAEW